ncbi:MAG: hypothetical protein IKV53_07360 [Clostridia bacterium]|nr:hypothetical protein [Clostridia bacterium]
MLEVLFILIVTTVGRLFTSDEEFRKIERAELRRGLIDGSVEANMRRGSK